MTALDPIIFRELPVIRQIIRDETWLEAERRGCCVMPNDRVVRENVCRVVLRIGEELRVTTQRAVDTAPTMIRCPVEPEPAAA